jgi:amino acid transporter
MKGFNSPRMRWALVIALVSDALGFAVVLFPPLQWLLDAITAAALLMVLGFRWPLLIALAIEVIPAIELFPAWTLVVLSLMTSDKTIPNNN